MDDMGKSIQNVAMYTNQAMKITTGRELSICITAPSGPRFLPW